MDIITIGVTSLDDRKAVEALVATTKHLELVWDFASYNIECEEGLVILKKMFRPSLSLLDLIFFLIT